jgi:hypothetical protein
MFAVEALIQQDLKDIRDHRLGGGGYDHAEKGQCQAPPVRQMHPCQAFEMSRRFHQIFGILSSFAATDDRIDG